MTGSTRLQVAAIAALYALWLLVWIVLGDEPGGLRQRHWDQAAAAAVAAVAALSMAWTTGRPYRGFLALHAIAFSSLAGSWLTYEEGSASAPDRVPIPGPRFVSLASELLSDGLYALCAFSMLCAWSYLALGLWHRRALTPQTVVVFTVLMTGLGAIFTGYYTTLYATKLDTPLGRLDAATVVLEFAVVVAGLLCVLLRVRAHVVWMLVASAVLMAGDSAYSMDVVPPVVDAVWMFGQLLWVAAIVGMGRREAYERFRAVSAGGKAADAEGRSGLSGILILLSLGSVLLSPLVWFVPSVPEWKFFFSVLFIVALVVTLVWITDRFDDGVAFLRRYVQQALRARLLSDDWREAPRGIRNALQSTRLGTLLDEFRGEATRLRGDVLFLGRERLYGPPRERAAAGSPVCFIVMPFGQEWSADVHRILVKACDAAGARAVRGDDLFTPSDILEDIWQGIHAADFVIADITGRNPNVLYELGIAHTLAKPVLILSRLASDIPIDLATRRVTLYGQSAGDWREDLAQKIQPAVAALVSDCSSSAQATTGAA
jgi:hypothetical protein